MNHELKRTPALGSLAGIDNQIVQSKCVSCSARIGFDTLYIESTIRRNEEPQRMHADCIQWQSHYSGQRDLRLLTQFLYALQRLQYNTTNVSLAAMLPRYGIELDADEMAEFHARYIGRGILGAIETLDHSNHLRFVRLVIDRDLGGGNTPMRHDGFGELDLEILHALHGANSQRAMFEIETLWRKRDPSLGLPDPHLVEIPALPDDAALVAEDEAAEEDAREDGGA